MATGRKTVVVGQVIDPVVWGNPLWDQSVQWFVNAADRTAQFATPKMGAVTWLEDVKQLQVFDGTAWQVVSTGQEWATFAGSWLTAGSPVTIGTGGAIAARWAKYGHTVDVRYICVTGTGFSGGANLAAWSWTLPAAAPAPAATCPVFGWVQAPGGAIALAPVAARIVQGGTAIDLAVTGPGNALIGGFALPAGSVILLQARYEV